jgi:hypothetical protein
MLKKKLLTLACALGILSFGACFPIPIGQQPSPPPPPPPIRLDLQGIRSIRVAVENRSELQHLDPAILAQEIANQINWQSRGALVGGHAESGAQYEDAVLNVTILSETATPSPGMSVPGPPGTSRAGNWSLLFKISATLTRKDGLVVWRQSDADYPVPHMFGPADLSAMWKNATRIDQMPQLLSRRLVHRMLNGDHTESPSAPLQ